MHAFVAHAMHLTRAAGFVPLPAPPLNQPWRSRGGRVRWKEAAGGPRWQVAKGGWANQSSWIVAVSGLPCKSRQRFSQALIVLIYNLL